MSLDHDMVILSYGLVSFIVNRFLVFSNSYPYRAEWRGVFLSSDVVLETVTYGGTINSGCHGAGKTQVRTHVMKNAQDFTSYRGLTQKRYRRLVHVLQHPIYDIILLVDTGRPLTMAFGSPIVLFLLLVVLCYADRPYQTMF